MPPSSSRANRPRRPQPAARSRNRATVLFAVVASVMVCLLVGGVVGTIVIDAWRNGDGSNSSQSSGQQVSDTDLEKAMKSDADQHPNDADAQAGYASYLSNMGRTDEAIPYYERAVNARPDDWTIRLNFGQALMNAGKLADAEFQFDQIVKGNKQNPQAWYYLGELYRRWTPPRTDEAIYAYEQAIASGPNSYVATLAGQALQSLGVATPSASPGASPVASPAPSQGG